jgi:hypothetical protein
MRTNQPIGRIFSSMDLPRLGQKKRKIEEKRYD